MSIVTAKVMYKYMNKLRFLIIYITCIVRSTSKFPSEMVMVSSWRVFSGENSSPQIWQFYAVRIAVFAISSSVGSIGTLFASLYRLAILIDSFSIVFIKCCGASIPK